MAIFHFSMKVISRGKGHSAIAAAAYRTASALTDERTGESQDYRAKGTGALAAAAYRSGQTLSEDATGKTEDYSRRRGVAHAEIMAPDNAPEWARDRSKLWNEVERAEKRKDAQLARDMVIALPHELTPDQRLTLLRSFLRSEFVDRGMVADFAIHRPDNDWRNHHAHVMLTMRSIGPTGFGKKVREWNAGFAVSKEGQSFAQTTSMLDGWRKAWADHANEAMKEAGHEARIDHRSYKDQGIDKVPGVHLGKAHYRGGDQATRNLEISNDNDEIAELQASIARAGAEIIDLEERRGRGRDPKRYAFRERKKAGAELLPWQNQRMAEQQEAAVRTIEARDKQTRLQITPGTKSTTRFKEGRVRGRSNDLER